MNRILFTADKGKVDEIKAEVERIVKEKEALNSILESAQEACSDKDQIAKVAEYLNRLTENLQKMVSQFEVDSHENGVVRKFEPTRPIASRYAVGVTGRLIG